MTFYRLPTPAQLRLLQTGTGTRATIRAAYCSGWCTREGVITESGRWILERVKEAEGVAA